MFCVKADIPQWVCGIDDELKAAYHSKDSMCIWVFETRVNRNRFAEKTDGVLKGVR